MPSINDLDACQRVAMMRRGGIPDSMIATELGVSLDALRRACPDEPGDPLGLNPPRHLQHPPHFKGAPLDLTPPATPLPSPSSDGDGLALLLVLMLLAS